MLLGWTVPRFKNYNVFETICQQLAYRTRVEDVHAVEGAEGLGLVRPAPVVVLLVRPRRAPYDTRVRAARARQAEDQRALRHIMRCCGGTNESSALVLGSPMASPSDEIRWIR